MPLIALVGLAGGGGRPRELPDRPPLRPGAPRAPRRAAATRRRARPARRGLLRAPRRQRGAARPLRRDRARGVAVRRRHLGAPAAPLRPVEPRSARCCGPPRSRSSATGSRSPSPSRATPRPGSPLGAALVRRARLRRGSPRCARAQAGWAPGAPRRRARSAGRRGRRARRSRRRAERRRRARRAGSARAGRRARARRRRRCASANTRRRGHRIAIAVAAANAVAAWPDGNEALLGSAHQRGDPARPRRPVAVEGFLERVRTTNEVLTSAIAADDGERQALAEHVGARPNDADQHRALHPPGGEKDDQRGQPGCVRNPRRTDHERIGRTRADGDIGR